MLKKIKQYLQDLGLIKRQVIIDQLVDVSSVSYEGDEIIRKALAHYCEICDIGFKTAGGTKNHKRLKHKA